MPDNKQPKVYDTIIIGAGPAGLYLAYQLKVKKPDASILIFEAGNPIDKRVCPVVSGESRKCVNCQNCAIMTGVGGAGAYSDFKYNITNDFGGTLFEKISKKTAEELMYYVDSINGKYLSDVKLPELFVSQGSKYSKLCTQNNLHLLNAKIRHLGTENGQVLIKRMYEDLLKKGVEFRCNNKVDDWGWQATSGWTIYDKKSDEIVASKNLVFAVGRSGSKWLSWTCADIKHKINVTSNRVDLGVRFELPYEVFSDLTDELYESKIVYKTETFEDNVRTFCMNPHGIVVNENTNGIITVNGHSYEDKSLHTNNTNFALLVSQKFTEPFRNSNEYGENIATLANQLSGGNVIVQRFGDLIKGRRSTQKDLNENSVVPTLKSAVAGDISLCLPYRFCKDIIEMIYALDKIAPGTANPDNLLYATEVKFYNSQIEVDENLEINTEGYANGHIYCIGDGSGWTHSLSQAASSGIYVADKIFENIIGG